MSLHFGLVGLHFLAVWPCGPSFPCILALWAFISFHFGLVGLHFLAFWPCGPSFPCILALWAFISLHFGLVGLHFLAFWPCGSLFPCIFALFGVSFWPPPPACCQKWPVCPTSLQWIYQHRNRLHFAVSSLPGLHFRAFWPCGPSFPFISGQALALRKRPLPEIGFFCLRTCQEWASCRSSVPPANDPYLQWDFLLAPLAGKGVFPVKPLPPANDPCLKWDFLLAPLPGMDFLFCSF